MIMQTKHDAQSSSSTYTVQMQVLSPKASITLSQMIAILKSGRGPLMTEGGAGTGIITSIAVGAAAVAAAVVAAVMELAAE